MITIVDAAILFGAWVLSAVLAWRIAQPGSFFFVLDHPNARSLHTSAVPRGGGVAILAAILIGGLVAYAVLGLPTEAIGIGIAALGLGLVSFIEDRYGVKRRFRLMAHLAAALLLLVLGLGIEQLEFAGWTFLPGQAVSWVLTLLFVVWMTNLYNFMDGMDGFAGGMAVFGFGTLALLGAQADDPAFTLASGLIAASAAGFLVWNLPPAKLFMGDGGSAPLGFLSAALSLWGVDRGLFPIWIPLLIFSPFVVDATVTLIRRLLQGERIWEAHRSHYYQRLVGMGWSHRQTVFRAYLLMLACCATALQASAMVPAEQLWVVAIWSVIYGLVAFKVHLMERRQEGVPR